MWSKTSGETMQSRSNASCRCAHAGVIFSPPPLGVLIRGYGMEAIDTTRSYVMQQGSKEKHTVSLTLLVFTRILTAVLSGRNKSHGLFWNEHWLSSLQQ